MVSFGVVVVQASVGSNPQVVAAVLGYAANDVVRQRVYARYVLYIYKVVLARIIVAHAVEEGTHPHAALLVACNAAHRCACKARAVYRCGVGAYGHAVLPYDVEARHGSHPYVA